MLKIKYLQVVVVSQISRCFVDLFCYFHSDGHFVSKLSLDNLLAMLADSAYYRLIHQEISIKLTSTRFKALDLGNPVVSNVEP